MDLLDEWSNDLLREFELNIEIFAWFVLWAKI